MATRDPNRKDLDMAHLARVLLVSDSQDEREMYGHALRLSGYCTLQAATGEAALRLAEELQPSAVIISEGRLRDHPATARLRSVLHGPPAAPPLVILTNYVGSLTPVESQGGDGIRVLMKPCIPEDLVRTVDELLAPVR
jgi:two-component system cell cycle response regulator DivK